MKNLGFPRESVNKIGFLYYYKIIITIKKNSIIFYPVCSKNLGPPKKNQYKISFRHYNKIINSKKPLGYL